MEKELNALLRKHADNRRRYERLQRYYNGNTDINERMYQDISKPNNHLVNSYSSYIVDIILGYFAGNPISYSSEEEELMERVQQVLDLNEEVVVNTSICKQVGIKGRAFEVLFLDENGDIRFAKLNAEECFIVYNDDIIPKKEYAVRMYKRDGDNYIDVYTKDEIMTYRRSTNEIKLIETVPHFFGDVPVVEYINNEEGIGDFERVISLIDSYDAQRSNTQNDFDYFTDCYLKMTGNLSIDEETIQDMKQNRLLLMPENSEADFLIKNINDTALENHLNRLKQDIHKFSFTPDLTDDKFGQSISGIALQFKLFGLSQIAIQKENYMRKGLYERLELIIRVLQIKGMREYDKDDVSIMFKRNMPINELELIESAVMLKGIVSDETAISRLPFVEDVAEEIEKIKEQQEYRLSDFDKEDDEDEQEEI